ncbi:MAG: hypothetical protein J6I73_04735 [Treponema sp.]|nr:hypothetical protein [Treponema sp.]
MKQIFAVYIALFIVTAPVVLAEEAQKNERSQLRTLEELVGKENAIKLCAEGVIVDFHTATAYEYALVPKSLFAGNAFQNRVYAPEGYMVECLYLVDKNELVKNNARSSTADTSIDVVSKIVRSISKMEGMTYISPISGEEHILYKRMYTMAGKDDDTPVPDKTDGNANGLIIYMYQHDRLLGRCKYRISYYQSDDEIYMTFLNLTNINIGFIKAVKAEKFCANMIIVDCDGHYLVYIGGEAARKRISFISDGINKAFYARLDALYSWFVKQF